MSQASAVALWGSSAAEHSLIAGRHREQRLLGRGSMGAVYAGLATEREPALEPLASEANATSAQRVELRFDNRLSRPPEPATMRGIALYRVAAQKPKEKPE